MATKKKPVPIKRKTPTTSDLIWDAFVGGGGLTKKQANEMKKRK